jgi:pyruvate-formate lyase-activating enzyme
MKKNNDPWISSKEELKILENKRKQINAVSPSFCTAKWLQTTLILQNGFNHSCHHPSPHKIPVSEVEENPAALHNSKFKKEQRAKMLRGERPKECDYCWKIEDLGENYSSDRHHKTSDYWAWDRFEEIANSDPDADMYPSYLEVSFSNACNFACAYCSPEISSKWMEDIKQNGPYPVEFGSHHLDHIMELGKLPYKNSEHNPYVDAFWKWFPDALPHLKVFRMTGGEPTMSKDFWETLEYIKKSPSLPDLEIAINTNLGVPDELIDKLIIQINSLASKVKDVVVYTSAESKGSQAEYVRDGIDYNKWMANIKKVLDNTDSRVCVMTTINILSLPTFDEFVNDIMQLRVKYNPGLNINRIPLSVNYLRFPPHLQVTLLDSSVRNEYAEKIEKHFEQWTTQRPGAYLWEFQQIKTFCDYMRTDQTSGPKYRRNFVDFIKQFDRRRGKNFSETFPEFAHLLIEWDNYEYE